MKTQKNTITVEVLTEMFTDTKQPFFRGDWLTLEKVDEIKTEDRYYIQEKDSTTGTITVLQPNVERGICETHDLYKVKSISRFL